MNNNRLRQGCQLSVLNRAKQSLSSRHMCESVVDRAQYGKMCPHASHGFKIRMSFDSLTSGAALRESR